MDAATERKIKANPRKALQISEDTARKRHPDFDQKFAIFYRRTMSGSKSAKKLYDNVMNSDDPAEAAYRAGASHWRKKK